MASKLRLLIDKINRFNISKGYNLDSFFDADKYKK